ncbi:MAG: ADP-ribosylation factor-directed GTPase activating protein isoform b [Planctomycetota bacterium]|nr:MAG: ADP-ribosylation factor-directed GTPase activating protein isoform b [Planctomycetota bacterium]
MAAVLAVGSLLLLSGCQKTSIPLPAAPSASADADRDELCRRIDAALAYARDRRLLDASVHGAWQVVHGILAFGAELPLATAEGRTQALPYLLGGGGLTGWRIRPAAEGLLATIDEGSTTGQGHPDQWLGYLSQCGAAGLPIDTPIEVAGRMFTLRDLLTQAQADIRPGREATWTLMALAAWLPTDASWTSSDGRSWSVEDVVAMEAGADIDDSACGGAHRLYGLLKAVQAHRQALHPQGAADAGLSGGWAAAQARIDDLIERARRYQQPDGGFSIHFFQRPGNSPDVFARLGATGHVFEVLAVALNDDRLAEPWVTRAAMRLVVLLEQTADVDVECGALYHAAHGLLLYRQRICGSSLAAGE